MKIKNIISGLLGATVILTHNVYAQTTTNLTTQSSATLSATCSINAQSLSWGTLVLPLSAQYASSQMNILCNKGAPYTIDLAYGGVYGQGTGISNYYVIASYGQCTKAGPCYTWINYNIFNTSGVKTGTSSATLSVTDSKDYTAVKQGFASYMGCSYLGNNCNKGSPSYSYGIMSGLSKGDGVAYSIYVPNESSKVWNAGQNSYTDTGTGISQSIPINARLVPENSSSRYPAPDFYMDAITATINY